MRIGKLKIFEHRKIDDDPVLGPLLERWIIFRHPKLFGIFLHKLNRSDHDRALHDHPWSFVSLVLKNGYREEHFVHNSIEHNENDLGYHTVAVSEYIVNKPGQVLWRPAEWRHRVIIRDKKPAWTLVILGPRCRKWGFWIDKGLRWCWWAKYDTHKAICEEEPIWNTDGDDV